MMSARKTWLLPDGVADVLPQEAYQLEQIRRTLLDTLSSRGYELVITPLIEFTDSLLIDQHPDLNVVTCKITDQYTGKTLGVRADISPQVARIDAHVLACDGIARYCYASSVLHAKMNALTPARAPIQLGAELFGSNDLSADIEIIHTMLATLRAAGIEDCLLVDLSHVGLLNGLLAMCDIDSDTKLAIQDAFIRKAPADIAELTQQLPTHHDFMALATIGDDLTELSQQLSPALLNNETISQHLKQLQELYNLLVSEQNNLNITVSVDAAELSNYHYHTGLVFAVYSPHHHLPVAKGGRYDGIGRAFGKNRPATGFSLDLHRLSQHFHTVTPPVVFIPYGVSNPALASTITHLQQQGYRVIQGIAHEAPSQDAHIFDCQNTEWQITTLGLSGSFN